jgi:hypothetical protein
MTSPQKHKTLQTIGPLLVGLLSATSIIAAFKGLETSKNANNAPSARTVQLPLCPAQADALGAASSDLRGYTDSVPWTVFNQQLSPLPLDITPVAAGGIPTGRAIRIAIPRAGLMAHEIGVSMLNTRPIKAGETLDVRIWMRSEDAPALSATYGDTALTPVKVGIRLQNNEPGFRRFVDTTIPITSTFREYRFTAEAPKDYCPGKLNVAVHMATGRHKIDIGVGSIKATIGSPS